MLSFETALRLLVVGQEILIATLILFGNGSRSAKAGGALFLSAICGYLLVSDSTLRNSLEPGFPLLALLALLVPHGLWLFARAIFEAPWPRWWILAGFGLIVILVWLIFVGQVGYGQRWVRPADIVMHIASLVIVAHALVMAAKGRPDDLVEQRRQFRSWFIAIVAIQVGAVLVVELSFGAAVPGQIALLNIIVIAVLTMALAVPLLQVNPEFFPAPSHDPPSPTEANLSAAESVLKNALQEAMADGAYRQSGLTISALASRLGHPEHHLRKLINGRLGFRNFSAYVNSYRIPAATAMLADPELVRRPILSIALDLGYGSLGPFNRAFKAATGKTPSEYREASLSSRRAESG